MEPPPPPVDAPPAPPAPGPGPTPAGAPAAALAWALVGLAAVGAATAARFAPPPARGPDAPAEAFSAARAAERLARVLGDQAPRPAGTAANARARERLLAELRGLGCAVEVQEAWAWSRHGRGARVTNVLARLPGGGAGQAVLLLCHHDSVPAGPGASDDGQGIAVVLEAARALLAGPPPARPVLLAFTDGEELGLLGARAFVHEHPWARDVGAVINVEARGTSGPSFMFETTPGSAWMVPLLADLPRPLCSSLFPTVYERLPNDTDLTVFLEQDDPPAAFNFACIGDVDRYHTPLDDLAHLSLDTLQHQGDGALALARGLAGAPLEDLRRAAARAVYFDILGLVVVRWPEPWSLPLALAALALLGAGVAARVRAGALAPRALAWGLAAWALGLGAALLAGRGLAAALAAAAGGPTPWAASPRAAPLAFAALAWAAVAAVAAGLAPRAGAWGSWAGAWLGWAALGAGLAVAAPGACFAFVAPALVAGAAGLAAALRPGRPALDVAARLAPLLAAACLWLPMARGLEWALGLGTKLPVTVAAAVLAGVLAPLLPPAGPWRRGLPAAGAGAAAVLALAVLAAGPHSPERPQRVNVLFEEDADRGAARVAVEVRSGPVPAAMVAAAGLAAAEGPGPGPAGRLEAPAAPLGLAPPELVVLEDGPGAGGGRRVRARARSPRGAWAVALRLEVPTAAVTVDGRRHAPPGGLRTVDLLGLGPEGVEVLLELPAGPVGYTLTDASFGAAAPAAALVRARPAWAVPSQQGDLTTVSRTGRL